MTESEEKKDERSRVAAVPGPAGEDLVEGRAPAESHRAVACPVALCPVCAAVALLQPLNPEVVEHLLNAGREFLLAAKAALVALSTDAPDENDEPLEKIDIG